MELADAQETGRAWLKGPVPAFRGLEHLRLVLEPRRPGADPGEASLASVASGR